MKHTIKFAKWDGTNLDVISDTLPLFTQKRLSDGVLIITERTQKKEVRVRVGMYVLRVDYDIYAFHPEFARDFLKTFAEEKIK